MKQRLESESIKKHLEMSEDKGVPLLGKGLNYKQFYYTKKFHVKKEDYLFFLKNIKYQYIKGLVWNYKYYYQGCVSWSWYYPFYYAPFISDLENFSDLVIEFPKDEPVDQLEQLLSIMPFYSYRLFP